MQPKRLHEGSIYQAEFYPTINSKDDYHCILVKATSVQEVILAMGDHLPKTDCELRSVTLMTQVRGVIV